MCVNILFAVSKPRPRPNIWVIQGEVYQLYISYIPFWTIICKSPWPCAHFLFNILTLFQYFVCSWDRYAVNKNMKECFIYVSDVHRLLMMLCFVLCLRMRPHLVVFFVCPLIFVNFTAYKRCFFLMKRSWKS